jgi:hypothetical protein
LLEVDITKLLPVHAKDRVLLLPHCLRRTETCRAKYNRHGLICAGCTQDCPVNRLSSAAVKQGYKGVCVAPGGRLAVSYINEIRPEAIVAIACEKELEEGVGNVSGIDGDDYSPVIVIIPLSKDGCVDTEVDVAFALSVINAGLEK